MVAPFSMILRPFALVSGSWATSTVTNIDDNVLSGAGDGVYIEADKDDDGATLVYSVSVLGGGSGFDWPIGYCDQLLIYVRYASNVTQTFTISYSFSGGTSSGQTITTVSDSLFYDASKTWALTSGPEAFGSGGTLKDRILVNIQAPAAIASGKWLRIDYIYVNLATRPHDVLGKT